MQELLHPGEEELDQDQSDDVNPDVGDDGGPDVASPDRQSREKESKERRLKHADPALNGVVHRSEDHRGDDCPPDKTSGHGDTSAEQKSSKDNFFVYAHEQSERYNISGGYLCKGFQEGPAGFDDGLHGSVLDQDHHHRDDDRNTGVEQPRGNHTAGADQQIEIDSSGSQPQVAPPQTRPMVDSEHEDNRRPALDKDTKGNGINMQKICRETEQNH